MRSLENIQVPLHPTRQQIADAVKSLYDEMLGDRQ
jgi:hypothetical protein